MDTRQSVLRLLPEGLRPGAIPEAEWQNIQEIRLRCGRRPALLGNRGERSYGSRPVTGEDLQKLLQRASEASPYAVRSSLRQGYVTARGGIRAAFCGEAVREGGHIVTLRAISSAALRLPHEVRGIGARYAENFISTLILSPPGGGKTTLLRDMVRLLSDGGRRVSVLDERGEIAGVVEGVASFDVGERTDVLTGGDKGEGAMLLLRAMNPQVLAMDEITAAEDCEVCLNAVGCGVELLATAHAAGVEDLGRREVYEPLLRRGVFRRALVIEPVTRRIREVYL